MFPKKFLVILCILFVNANIQLFAYTHQEKVQQMRGTFEKKKKKSDTKNPFTTEFDLKKGKWFLEQSDKEQLAYIKKYHNRFRHRSGKLAPAKTYQERLISFYTKYGGTMRNVKVYDVLLDMMEKDAR